VLTSIKSDVVPFHNPILPLLTNVEFWKMMIVCFHG
jgi:hypothetical protein